jgi:hypothetical protein
MRFEAGNISSITTATAGTPIIAIRSPATERCALRELGVTLIDATETRLGLVRATTVSLIPADTKAGQNHAPGAPASGSLLVSSFGTAPVIDTTYLRRILLPNSKGAGFIWQWPADDPLIVGSGAAIAEIVLANLVSVACGTFEYWAVWEN